MNKKLPFVLLLLVLSLTLLSGCTVSLKKIQKRINNSSELYKNMEMTMVISDKDIPVYEYKNVTTIENTKANVTKTISKLNERFVLESEDNTSTIDNVSRNELTRYTLNEEYFLLYNYGEDTLTCEVSKKYFNNVITSNDITHDLDILDKAEFVFTFEEENLTKVTISFKLQSQRDVAISIIYQY